MYLIMNNKPVVLSHKLEMYKGIASSESNPILYSFLHHRHHDIEIDLNLSDVIMVMSVIRDEDLFNHDEYLKKEFNQAFSHLEKVLNKISVEKGKVEND